MRNLGKSIPVLKFRNINYHVIKVKISACATWHPGTEEAKRFELGKKGRERQTRQGVTALHISYPETQSVSVAPLTKCERKGENNFQQKGWFLLYKLVISEYCSLSEIFARSHSVFWAQH